MSYEHPLLGQALAWKFNDPPVTTFGGRLVKWHLDPWPTDSDLAQWVQEYVDYKKSTQYQDDCATRELDANKALKAIALLGVDKGVWTLAELRAKYRSL